MHDELTKVDIEKMQAEIKERKKRNAALRENVRAARELGDLSENDEYRSARREWGRNNSRIAYLENMIRTAVVIEDNSKNDEVGLFDWVELYYENLDEISRIRLVTTLRNDVLTRNISKESPVGKAIMGKKVGDRVLIEVNDKFSYYVVIKSIEKSDNDPDIPISSF
ncbi:MAG: transcription elongation factor GreA [Ruminococcaceae bacterium]|nr:transcription elongation factor GreA [Oscillospiraceae bacterium]